MRYWAAVDEEAVVDDKEESPGLRQPPAEKRLDGDLGKIFDIDLVPDKNDAQGADEE